VGHLSLTEVKTVLDFLWRVRRTVDHGSFIALILQGLKTLIPCELVGYYEVHAASGSIHATALPTSVLVPEGTSAITRHYRDHPLILHHIRTGDGTPRRVTDMASMRMFRGTALFSEVYRPARIGLEMAMALPAAPGVVRCVALGRDGRDFSERDLEVLHLVRPYLCETQRDLDATGNVQSLSPRERDVLALVARGKTNVEIAAVLSISPRTAQKHLEHIYDKLGIRRRAGAAMLAQVHHFRDSVPGK
jgi:DNA-binding CsgD family transcriptional regulator